MPARSRRFWRSGLGVAVKSHAARSGEVAASWTPESLSSVYGWWQHDYAGSLFEERTSPTTASSDGGVVGTWRSRSTGSVDIPAETDARRPIYREGRGVSFFWNSDGTDVQARMLLGSISTINRNDFGGGMVVEWPGTAYTGIDFDSASEFAIQPGAGNASSDPKVRYFDGSGFVSTTKNPTCRRTVITWRGNGTDMRVWVNGSLFTGTALSSATLDRIVLGGFSGGALSPVLVSELILTTAAPSDADMDNLNTYLRSRAGTLGDGNLVALLGDSITIGVGAASGRPWHDYVTNRSASEWRSYAYDGAFLHTVVPITAANLVTAGSGYTEKVAVLYIGTNDINSGSRTGAQLFSDMDAYRTTLQASGWTVVGCTLPNLPNNDTEAQAFNTALLASGDFDAVADLRADAALDDYTDTTYFTDDGVHPKDAGHAAIGAVVQATLAAI